MNKQDKSKNLRERVIQVKTEIQDLANTLCDKYGAPVVIVVAGSGEAQVPQCLTVWKFPGEETRLRDIVGVLQTAIQIESLAHIDYFEVKGKVVEHEQLLKRLLQEKK